MDEAFKILNSYKFDSKDFQVTANTPWNYALYLPSDQEANTTLSVVVRGMQKGLHPFSYEGTPVMINAKVLQWGHSDKKKPQWLAQFQRQNELFLTVEY